jgi:hypothetical protein
MKKTLLAMMAVVGGLLAACGPAAVQVPSPTATPSLTLAESPPPIAAPTRSVSPAVVASIVATVCAPPAFASCSHGLELALANEWESGDLVAVCNYGDGTGNVLWVDSGKEADAEAICSADGLISTSNVVRVVRLP